jgi:flagellar motor switch/type III secretory pathway protein FliN
LKDKDENVKNTGKIFISLPEALLSAEQIHGEGNKFTKADFNKTLISGNVYVGSMKSSLYDIKNLDSGDVVVLDNSNIEKLRLNIKDNNLEIRIKPNMELVIAQEENINIEGDNGMPETHNLWDSIEVDMDAEFDSVKITLGELKNIEEGLVVDLASLYKNNVTLKVEGKPIANGSLVIVNDRYGVKIKNVIAGENAGAQPVPDSDSEENPEENLDNEEYNETTEGEDEEYNEEEYNEEEEVGEESSEEEGEEDFDYSDFELEDENL